MKLSPRQKDLKKLQRLLKLNTAMIETYNLLTPQSRESVMKNISNRLHLSISFESEIRSIKEPREDNYKFQKLSPVERRKIKANE
jgi:hypothetical protein